MKTTYLFPNWLRRLWHRITRKPDERLEEWERIEYRKLKCVTNQDHEKPGDAS